jgi:hypothetical protein
MFCMTTCRPDLAHAGNSLSRRMSAPRVCDLSNARRTLKYLNGTRRLGLLFNYEVTDEHKGLVAYADADWANDRLERRSTSGSVILHNGTPISWYSGLQSVVAMSSCEAEYVALSPTGVAAPGPAWSHTACHPAACTQPASPTATVH